MGELELDSIDRMFLSPSDPAYDRDYRRALCHRVLLRNDETLRLTEKPQDQAQPEPAIAATRAC
jgi:hypothetical protein